MPRSQPGGGAARQHAHVRTCGDTGPFKTYLAHASQGPGGESLVKISNTIGMRLAGATRGSGDVPSGFPYLPGRRCRCRCPGSRQAGYPSAPDARLRQPAPGRSGRGARSGPPRIPEATGAALVCGPRIESAVRTVFGERASIETVRMADPAKAISRPRQPMDLAVEGEDIKLALARPRPKPAMFSGFDLVTSTEFAQLGGLAVLAEARTPQNPAVLKVAVDVHADQVEQEALPR